MPSPPGLFAIFVIGLLFVLAVVVVVWIGSLPAKIARRRNHPQVDAINALSWLGLLLTGGIGWAGALVWALVHYDPNSTDGRSSRTAVSGQTNTTELEARVAKLEQLLANSPDGKGEA